MKSTKEAKVPVRATKQKGKDVAVSFRLDEAVVDRFNDYAFYKRGSKKEALQTIISEYLDGLGMDEFDRLGFERFERSKYTTDGNLQTLHFDHFADDGGSFRETVDGRNRYDLGGIKAEGVIVDVMERVESAEGFGMSQAWDVGNALKYLLRAGRKDALDMELGKAENYLHHALTGEWFSEEGTHGVETA